MNFYSKVYDLFWVVDVRLNRYSIACLGIHVPLVDKRMTQCLIKLTRSMLMRLTELMTKSRKECHVFDRFSKEIFSYYLWGKECRQ